ncbi:MAG TPA: FAD binding domain-containing protein [Kiritimatiellia bacterium]|nr:FAD binding domain-containing protein [Kiritimatiellia bacterium]HRZ13179.1 FAD binding domain-containing protein [Kiritimatiellia bacterium]HSA17600.1 FAD binding domain-containing protein [Kiritimatiellia bacterium]
MRTVEDIEIRFPGSLAEALAWQADEKTRGRPLAGGTDLMVQWESGVAAIPERAVSLWGLKELKGIRETPRGIEIGAMTTHTELRSSPLVREKLPALAAAAATVGGRQIQNRGTIAGNVANASPAGDLAPTLLITDGLATAASASGRRDIPLAKLFTGYRKLDVRADELLVSFTLPALPAGAREKFHKIGTRAAQAISKVMGACRVRVQNGTIVSLAVSLGSVAPVPVRLPELEQWIAGRRVDLNLLEEVERRASAEVHPIDDIRSTATYRKWVSGRLVRALLEA